MSGSGRGYANGIVRTLRKLSSQLDAQMRKTLAFAAPRTHSD
jgi:hypothetical protein